MIIHTPTSDELFYNFCKTLQKLNLCPLDADMWFDFIFSKIGESYSQQELAGEIKQVTLGAPDRDPG